MKRLFLLLTILTLMTIYCNGQNSNSFGLSIGTGKGFISMPPSDGGPTYELNLSLTIELKYFKRLNDKLTFESGVSWYKNQVTITPESFYGADITSTDYDIQLIYIPLFIKISPSRHFFINGGLIADFDVSGENHISNQTGIGTGLGLGTEFSVSTKLTLIINPYVNLHGTIMFNEEEINSPRRVFDSGLMIGLRTK